MKLLIIVYDSGIEEDVTELLDDLNLPGWTKVFGAHGRGGAGTKLGDPIWPGTNNVLYIAVAAEEVARILTAFADLQATFRRKPGVTPFVLPLDEVSALPTQTDDEAPEASSSDAAASQ